MWEGKKGAGRKGSCEGGLGEESYKQEQNDKTCYTLNVKMEIVYVKFKKTQM